MVLTGSFTESILEPTDLGPVVRKLDIRQHCPPNSRIVVKRLKMLEKLRILDLDKGGLALTKG